MTDPTLDILDRLRDESKWRIVRGAPIFKPHAKARPDGTLRYEVTPERLHRIVQNTDKLEAEDAVPTRILADHTKDGKSQTEQPAILGYAVNRRVGTWGPAKKLGILADLYYTPEGYEVAKSLPFRSAEYYPSRDTIPAVALLAKDPELDMGMVLCARDQELERYVMENDMAESIVLSSPSSNTAPPVKVHADGTLVLSDEQLSAAIEKYMREKQPAVPTPTPAPAVTPSEAKRMDGEELKVQLNRQNDTITRLERDLQAERYARQLARAEQQVTQLSAEGYQIKQRAKLVEKLSKLDDTTVAEELASIRENYQRVPVEGAPVRTAEGNAPAVTKDQMEAAVSLATCEKLSFDAALTKVRTKS